MSSLATSLDWSLEHAASGIGIEADVVELADEVSCERVSCAELGGVLVGDRHSFASRERRRCPNFPGR